METTLLIERFWGYALVSVSAIFLMNPLALNRVAAANRHEPFHMLLGLILLLLGIGTLLTHDIWVSGWQMLVTLIGWTTLIKGMLNLGLGSPWMRNYPRITGPAIRWVLILTAALGVFLIYKAGAMKPEDWV